MAMMLGGDGGFRVRDRDRLCYSVEGAQVWVDPARKTNSGGRYLHMLGTFTVHPFRFQVILESR